MAAETPGGCSNKLETDVAEAREEVMQMMADSTSGCLDLDNAGGTSGCLNQDQALEKVRVRLWKQRTSRAFIYKTYQGCIDKKRKRNFPHI